MTQTAVHATAARQPSAAAAPSGPGRDAISRQAARDQTRTPAAVLPDVSRVPVHQEHGPAAVWPVPIQRYGIGSHHETPIVIPARERSGLTGGSNPALISMLGVGRPLTPSESRAFPGWSDALGNVRVHDDPRTQLVAAILGDAGFAAGHHIALGHTDGSAPDRQRLLAHELTHVMQQRADVPYPPSADPERDAEHIADLVTRGDHNALLPQPAVAPLGFAERVIARYTLDLPDNMLLVIDVDDGDFVGGCVKAVVPHIGMKVIVKGVPKGLANQLLNIHAGIMTNAAGETCFFFYESVSKLCEMICFPTLDELKKRLGELRDWLKEKIEKLLKVLLPAAAAALLAYLIAEAIVAALAALGILALA
jgi:hypothetical protein